LGRRGLLPDLLRTKRRQMICSHGDRLLDPYARGKSGKQVNIRGARSVQLTIRHQARGFRVA
jgi:hypothetical protein